jgi:hypothetical protein
MASAAAAFAAAGILLGPCPVTPAPAAPPVSGDAAEAIDLSRLPGAADHEGEWLKKICSEAETGALCDGYIRGLIDTVEFWKVREANFYIHRMSYSDVRKGVREYLISVSMEEAEKMQAPELLLCALNAKFPLFE